MRGWSGFTSALGVHQFLRTMPVVGLDANSFGQLAQAAVTIAESEGLTAHAHAIEVRLEALKQGKGQ